MLRWVILFLCISIIAGVLGFTNISAAAADIAKIIFYIFVVLLLIGVVLLLIGK